MTRLAFSVLLISGAAAAVPAAAQDGVPRAVTVARAAAIKGCGDGRCKVAVAGKARCYAYFESRSGGYWYGLALHTNLHTAVSVARGGCTGGAPAGTCKRVKSKCD